MKDAWDSNNIKDGFLYGFVTTGEHWEVFRYNGTSFYRFSLFIKYVGTEFATKKRPR